MLAMTHADKRPSPVKHSPVLSRISWVGLLVLAAFPLLGAIVDLISDQRDGIPGDHNATFQSLTGMSVAQAKVSAPGLLRYVHQLEIGYAVHELVFAGLLLAVVAIPLRTRQRWAWFGWPASPTPSHSVPATRRSFVNRSSVQSECLCC